MMSLNMELERCAQEQQAGSCLRVVPIGSPEWGHPSLQVRLYMSALEPPEQAQHPLDLTSSPPQLTLLPALLLRQQGAAGLREASGGDLGQSSAWHQYGWADLEGSVQLHWHAGMSGARSGSLQGDWSLDVCGIWFPQREQPKRSKAHLCPFLI